MKTEMKKYKQVCAINGLNTEIDECPICHSKIAPQDISYVESSNGFFIIVECPNQNCNELFAVKYEYYKENVPGLGDCKRIRKVGSFPSKINVSINKNIQEISSDFIEIYTQASKAKELGLDQICGVGYRKALEFLIKDYCISCNKEDNEKIKKMQLAKVIDNYVENPNIKSMAQRATWLGNDETHYIRKWEDKDIEDLVNLIEITTKWIDLEVTTKKYNEEMSQPRK